MLWSIDLPIDDRNAVVGTDRVDGIGLRVDGNLHGERSNGDGGDNGLSAAESGYKQTSNGGKCWTRLHLHPFGKVGWTVYKDSAAFNYYERIFIWEIPRQRFHLGTISPVPVSSSAMT